MAPRPVLHPCIPLGNEFHLGCLLSNNNLVLVQLFERQLLGVLMLPRHSQLLLPVLDVLLAVFLLARIILPQCALVRLQRQFVRAARRVLSLLFGFVFLLHLYCYSRAVLLRYLH